MKKKNLEQSEQNSEAVLERNEQDSEAEKMN